MLGAGWLRSASLWRIQGIGIIGGSHAIQRTLTAAFPVHVGDSLWGFSREETEQEMLNQFPALTQVKIQRRWPARLVLRVRERVPIGWIWNGKTRWAVDETGTLFPVEESAHLARLPEFATPGSLDDRRLLAQFVKAWQNTSGPLQGDLARCGVQRPSQEFALWLRDGTCVFWGPLQEERMGEMRTRLSRVLADARTRYPAVEYADLRYPGVGSAGVAEGRILVKPKVMHSPLPRRGDGRDST